MQRILPTHKVVQNQNVIRPPAAGIHTQQQDVFFIPPPRAGGGAQGASTPVSTATLGLIHRADPSLAAQLREEPASLAVHTTRLRVYSTMRLIRTGMLGQHPFSSGRRPCISKMNNIDSYSIMHI